MVDNEEPSHAPLHGVRVLDLTRVVAGPLCGRLLADLGADVVKIEPPEPDLTRRIRPVPEATSPYFAQFNAGKRSMSIDLTVAGGAELIRRMAAEADVVLENFRPGVLARHGLEAACLLAENPRLIVCSISGYGQSGPWANRRAYAPTIHAEAGLLDLVGRRRHAEPAPSAQSHADLYTGCLAATAITTALFERTRTGKGQHLDVCLAEASLYTNEWVGLELGGGDRADWFGPAKTLVLELADGSFAATAGNPCRLFPLWATAMGRPELLEKPELATMETRVTNVELVHEHIRGFAKSVPDFAKFEELADRFGLVVGVVRSIEDLTQSDWAEERDVFATVEPGVTVIRRPWRSSTSPIGTNGTAAGVAEHSDEVCRSFGLSESEIEDLRSIGVLK